MTSYYILWLQDERENIAYLPLLFPKAKTLTQYVSMQYSDIDLARGLAHELWKPDSLLEAPKSNLLDRYSNLIAETFDDTLEDAFMGISEECRSEFGCVCSLHQLLSGWEVVPDSINIKKNLLADIVNVIQDGEMRDLAVEAQSRVINVLRDLSLFAPLSTFVHNPRTGYFVAQLYIVAHTSCSELTVANIIAEDAIKLFSLVGYEAQCLVDIIASNITPSELFSSLQLKK